MKLTHILRHPSLAALSVLTLAGCSEGTTPTGVPGTDSDLIGGILGGNVAVRARTTGSDIDPNGYSITLDGSRSRTISANGSTTYTGVSTGSHTVRISGVASNCTLQGSASRSVFVVVLTTVSVTYDIQCEPLPPTTGDLLVRAQTTGEDQDTGYTVTAGGVTRPIGANAEIRFEDLPAGNHSVALGGVAENCTVSGTNPRTVTVPAGGSIATNFGVTCVAVGGGALSVVGRGAIGDGPATPGGARVEFDFEADESPTGVVALIDYTIVRADGSVGRFSVNNAGDPETGVGSFRRTTATCVQFDGIGRLDTGALQTFVVDACDEASPGAGADGFRITLPDLGYVREGLLSEGEIAITE